ncbi:ATP-binding protein [Pseudomonadota bacterium]
MQFKDQATEARFLSSIESIRKIQIRSALFLASLLYLMVSILDFYIIPEKLLQQAVTIHLTQTVLFSIFGFYLFRSPSQKIHSTLAISAVVIAWSSHLFIAIVGGVTLLFAEAYLMLIWIWLVAGLPLLQSAKLNLLFICMLEVVLLTFNPFELATTLSHQYFVFVSLLLGSLGAYLTEFYKRQNFLNLEKVSEQTSALIKANDQLRHAQKMEAIGTLVGGVAHDFNNTLAAITGNIYLTKESVAHLPDTIKKLDTIEALAFRSAEIVKQLLAFSRKGIVNMQPMELSSFLSETIKLHSVILPENIEFHHEQIGSQEINIRADANQLEQVILNLLSNARDAVNDVNRPTISLHLEKWIADKAFKEKHPEIRSSEYARISVVDNGCGIDEECLEHMFEPFYTTKGVNEGTGLGLSMAYGALQSHGGTILVESEPGKGSNIQLYLPLLKDAELPEITKPNEIAAKQSSTATVLLADDDEAVLATIETILKRLGHKVITAKDGLMAVESYKVNSAEIDLVILDVVMPNMGGIEAYKEIKKAGSSASVIFITGYDPDQKPDVEGTIPEKVVMKPFNVAEFSRLIQSTLEQ